MVVGYSAATAFILGQYFNDPTHLYLTFKLSLGFTFRVNLFLNAINAIFFFVNRYNQSQLLAEKFQKESAEAQFNALRSQINPHFLFNSFNVLSSLVHKDPSIASKFIDQLSIVYRYVLNHEQNKIVPLKEELDFLESYIYLLKIRFQDNLSIEILVPEDLQNTQIAPATLQLLIENAIKHNVVSKSNPLNIKIFNDETHLIVENSILRKEFKEESTNKGLANIRRRYEYLCGKDAVITNSNGVFKVKIPIIKEI
jgi:LytS/YehU family sensor histidine kinase